MSDNGNQTEKLISEYTALAPSYDQRWSTYLHSSFTMTLEKVAGLPAERVLDVACGTGQLLAMLAQRSEQSELVGVDRVPAMLEVAKRRLGRRATVLECEARQLPFDDAYFQLVTSTNALHYFSETDVALREIRRVISSDGNLIITDWCRNFLWMKVLNRVLLWTRHSHVNTLSSSELTRCLTDAGFGIVSESRRKIDWFWGLMTIHAIPLT
jgi:ubiquinone/menaquinone biosynthesis C-methylase UbiE